MSKDVKRAADIVTSLFSTVDGNRLREANEFYGNWRSLVGEKLAAHSRVVDVDRGIVVVEVDHPGWSQQLSFVKKRVLSDLARTFPALGIKAMVVRVRPENGDEYHRPDVAVGAGALRVSLTVKEVEVDGEALESVNGEPAPHNGALDTPLQDVLNRLRESIRKGKPSVK